MGFLASLIPLLGGIVQPLKDYFANQAKKAQMQQELELAKIEAQKQAVIAGEQADTARIQTYLGATSVSFREGTFFFLVCPVLISIFMPNYATTMWHNFEAIPDWFRMLFAAVYGVIWGLPVAKDYIGAMFSAAGTALNDRREYKLEKARINRQAVFNTLKQSGILPKVISQQQVDLVDKALDAGEQ